ncbi:MAG TPA: zinc-dependent metalloprotease [Solirubrobacteraceae bacterium]|nr:zinc-dependent metalloprotease [Solirubrobacteraceae bacterium]
MDAIDWDIAQWIGERLAGTAAPTLGALPDMRELASGFARSVSDYSGLAPPAQLPPLEAVDRSVWIAANLAAMRPLLEPFAARRLGRTPRKAAPLMRAARGASALLLGAQVGAILGMLSQRVLGQYDVALLDESAPPRLLLVAPNLMQTARTLKLDREELTRWVAIHELTHAVQFTSASWLRDYLGGLIRELIERMQVSVAPADVLRAMRPGGVATMIERLARGEVLRVTLGESRWSLVERMQSAMSLIEGHAEHVMDAVGADLLPSLPRLRSALDQRRRQSRPLPWRVLERLLGLEMKMRQYEVGRRFCDEVVAARGSKALALAFAAPEALPTAAELAEPARWLARIA